MKQIVIFNGLPALPCGVASRTHSGWRIGALCSLLALLGSFVPFRTAAQNQSEIFFDASGTDQASFGPNEIITISGNVTYYGRGGPQVPEGIPDSFFPVSDVYIIPKGSLDTTDHGLLGVPLEDVSGSPNTIAGTTGGGFFGQVIGATIPQGSLKSGEYDIVVDEHQNKSFDLQYDLYLGGEGRTVLTVFIPSNVPNLPDAGIAKMKEQALAQANAALLQNYSAFADIAALAAANGHRLYGTYSADELFAVIQFLLGAELAFQCPECPPDVVALERSKPNLFEDARGLFAQTAKKYNAIAADPPDPDFAQVVALSPVTPLTRRDGDPLNGATLPLNRALQQESALADALLRALEKYQGAQQAFNGYWSLAHAREIQMYAGLLAAQIPRTRAALEAFRAAVVADPRDFDGAAAEVTAFQARVRQQGFTADQARALIGLGIPEEHFGFVVQAITAPNDAFSRSAFLAGLDSQIQTASAAPQSYLDLAAAMNAIITGLQALPELDTTQPTARFIVPASATVGKSLKFDASTSSDPQGLPLTIGWDFDGDGQFTDATGPVVSRVFPDSFSGHVGVSVTNKGDKASIAYVYLNVTDGDRPPVFTTVTPDDIGAAVVVGGNAKFTAAATDPDGDAVSFHWLVDGVEAGSGPSFTYTPVGADVGLHQVVVEARDGHSQNGIAAHAWLVTVTAPITLSDLTVTQTDSPDPVITGGNVTYAVTVKNNGPDTATSVTLSDTIPADSDFVSTSASQGTTSQNGGVVTALLGNLPSGASALVNVVVTSPGTPGTLTNSAVATAVALDLNPADNSSTKLTRVNAPSPNVADLSVSQYSIPTRGTANSPLTYNLVVNNLGPATATDVTLVDTLPSGVTFLSAAFPPDSVDGNVLRFNLSSIPAGTLGALSITVMPTAAGNLVNSAVVTANETDSNPANNGATLSTLVTAEAARITDLVLNQLITSNPTTLNSPVTLTLTVTNLGPDEATGATIVDALPAGLTFVSATPAPDLVSGSVLSFNTAPIPNGGATTVVIHALASSAGTLANIANVTSSNTDPNAPNNQSRLELLVNQTPKAYSDLAVNLGASTNQLPVGSNVTITIAVTNAGPDVATSTVVTAPLPTGLSLVTAVSSTGSVATQNGIITASLGNLASGTTATVTITGTATLGRPLVTVANAASDNVDSNSSNNVASITVLAVDTSATVAIERNFPDPEIDALQAYLAEMGLGSQVFDQEGLTFEQLQGFRLIIWDDLSYGAGGLGANDVHVLKSAHDAGARLYLIGDDLALSATYALVEPERSIWVDLLHLNATDQNFGGDGTMLIVNTNHPVVNGPFGLVGNSPYYYDPDATSATGTGEVVLGRSGPHDVLLAYKEPVTKNKTVTQNELVHTQTDDNGIVQRKILFQNAVAWLLSDDPVVDLAVTQSHTPASVSVGGDLIYTITVTNKGPDAVSGVTLTDSLPANAAFVSAQLSQGTSSLADHTLTADLGALGAKGSATVTLHVTAGPEEVLTNIVNVLGLEEDSNTNNNASVSLLTVGPVGSPGSVPKADLRLTQTAADKIGVGQWLAYTLTVANDGPYPATDVALSDLLPADVDFLSAVPSQGTAVHSSGTVNASLGTIASGDSATVSIVVRPTAVGSVANHAVVSSSTIDPQAYNNASAWTTLVTPALPTANLLVDVRASASSVPIGGEVTYRLTVFNTGPAQATGVQLSLPLPAGMDFVSATAGATPVNGVLTFNIGTLNAGASDAGGSVSMTTVLRAVVPGHATSTARASSIEGDSGSNSGSLSTLVLASGPPPADLVVLSAVSDRFVPVGSLLTFTITVTNASPTVATGVVLTDKLPASVAFISANASRGVVTQANGVVTVDIGNVASNDSPVILTIQAAPTQPDILINRASAAGVEPDGNGADNVSSVVATSEILITGVERSGDDLRVSFNAVVGKTYWIQTRPEVESGEWTTIQGSITQGIDGILQITLPNVFTEPHQYFRVLQTP